jgi:hypothetical protein
MLRLDFNRKLPSLSSYDLKAQGEETPNVYASVVSAVLRYREVGSQQRRLVLEV